MKRVLQLFILFFMSSTAVLNAQGIKLSGRVVEAANQRTIPGVGIVVINTRDTLERHLTATDINGNFSVSGLKSNTVYLLRTSILSFAEIERRIEIKNNSIVIGTLTLKTKMNALGPVVIEGERTPVVQKGDTTEMSASAYKVNQDANAQDLVLKMPGITVENGTIKAHGEDVKRVFVDGKKYFGDDAAMALQNLPAEVIDKVQVYNKLSDQAEFTGFDDGNSSKVLNIVTRADRRHGENGTITAGHDFNDKYLANGRLNVFRGDRKLTITGGLNNVNQQNYSTQDLLGVMGGQGSRGGSSYVGRSSGLNKPAAIGINYTDNLGKKVTLTGSYFFNKQDNYTTQFSNVQNIGNTDTSAVPLFQDQNSISSYKNYNHRFDMQLEINIDSANSIIWSPRFSTQTNNSSSFSNTLKYNRPFDTTYFINGNGSSDNQGYNYTSDLTLRHKFAKKGRTISLGITASGNYQDGNGLQYSLTRSPLLIDTTDLRSDSKTRGSSISSNLAYTEPIGTFSLLQFSYNVSFQKNSTDKYSFDQNTDTLDKRYSNVYKNDYNTQRAGLAYRIRGGEKLMASVGADYQLADLSGRRTYPTDAKVDKSFENILPNALVNYKFSKKANLRFFYRTSTNPPSVSQLQDVITRSSSLYFSQGNPDLDHEYTHRGALNIRFSNPDKFTNFGFNLFGTYIQNKISDAVYYVSRDSIITSGNYSDTIQKGGQLTKPVNLGASWNTQLVLNYGFLFMPIKCNLNFTGGIGYSTTPGSINQVLNTTNQYSLNGGVTIASNISQNADFRLTYQGNYRISNVVYDGDLSEFKSRLKNTSSNTWTHAVTLSSLFTVWQRLLIQNSLNEQLNTGSGQGYNQNYLLWNASLGLKVFKNKAGHVDLAVYDLLNQNRSINHSVSATSITDSRTNVLGRYFMLSFTYTLRNYDGAGEGGRHRDGFGGEGGGRMGGGGFGGGRRGGGF